MKQKMLTLLLMFSCLFFIGITYVPVYAEGDMDGVTQQAESNGEDYNSSVSDYLKGKNVIGDKEMAKANNLASPLVSVMGTIAGFIVLISGGAIFVITGLDLLYISVPFTRTYLAPAGGGNPMGGQPQGKQWVSDEALQLVGGGSQQGGMGAMNGMGAMGGIGGMSGMMGSVGGAPQGQQGTKSIITQYLKKRIFFIVIFFVCTIVLTSSIVSDCGINLGKLILKAISAFSGNVESYAS